MNLWGVAMVRNEEDIVEAFVRHNLAFLDGLVVLDHRSADGTLGILQTLAAEGLPVVALRTDEPEFFKASHVSALARSCLRDRHADFVFALDADEFIRAKSRESLEAALGDVPPHSHALHLWRSYVPVTFANGFGEHCMRYRLREEPIPRAKVIIRGTFSEAEDAMVSEGNHWVVDMRTRQRMAHHMIDPDVLCIAHCPVRNAAQLSRKAVLGYEARLAGGKGDLPPAMSSHWREIRDDVARGVELTDARLRHIAMNYTVPRDRWVAPESVALVDDPLELRAVRGPRAKQEP